MATTTRSPADTSTKASSDNNDNKGGDRLLTGAAGGIRIGAVVRIAAVVAGAWFILRKKRSDAVEGTVQEHNYTPLAKDGHDGWRAEAPSASEVGEIAGTPRDEIS
jgi:hypothetical protein